MGSRIFVIDGREFPDPDPSLSVDALRQSFTNFFPELYNAESKESKRGEDTIIEFKVGVLNSHIVSDIQAHLESLTEIIQPFADRRQAQPLDTREVVGRFLKSRRGTIVDESLTSYRHTLNAFAKHCPSLPLTPEELETYFARFKERSSAAAAYSPIKQLYEFCNERYDVPNAMKSVKRARFKEKEPYSFTLDEARAVLDACRNDRELALVHLYLGHGLRLEEGCRVNIGDIFDGQISVRGKERNEYLPLLPETREILLKLANGRSSKEPIFTGHKERRLSHKMTYNVVKAILRRAGVLEGKAEDLRIATHTLRKTFSTLALHAGCDGRIADRLLRHHKGDVGSLYFAMPMDALKANLERYSPIRLLNGHSQVELHKTEY